MGILPSRREARTDLRSFQSSDGNQVLPLSRPGQKIYCRMNIDEPTTSLAPSYQGPSPVILHLRQQWQREAFRHSIVRKLEEAIRDNSTNWIAIELERQVFSWTNTKEEYLGYVARLILNLRLQQDNQWQTEAFRHRMVRKLEEAIRDSGCSTDRNAVELERQVFSRANTEEEYLGYVARLILHVRRQSSGSQQGNMMGRPPNVNVNRSD